MLQVLREAFQENKKEFAVAAAVVLGIFCLYAFVCCLSAYN